MGTTVNPAANQPTRAPQPAANTSAAPAANNAAAAPQAAPAANAPEAAAPPKAHENQIVGIFDGFVKEGVDTIGGLYTLVTTNPITTAKGLVYMATHPRQAVQAIAEPYTTAFKEGNYGELAGRLSFQALTIVVSAGVFAKGADASKAADAVAAGTKAAAGTAPAAAAATDAVGGAAFKASLSASEATEKGVAQALESIAKKYPKMATDAVKALAEGTGSPARLNEFRALVGRYSAEASGLDAGVVKQLAEVAGKLPHADVYRYIQTAARAGLPQQAVSDNLAKFAAIAGDGGKLALRKSSGELDKAIAEAATAAVAPAAAPVAGAAAAGTTTVGGIIDGAIDGTANAAGAVVDGVKGAVEGVGNGIRKAGEAVENGVGAIKGVYNAEISLGDIANGVAYVPMAIGRGIGSAYNATIGRLLQGIANLTIVNPFEHFSLKGLAAVKFAPGHLLLAPVTLPLGIAKGAFSLAIHNPIRFMGVSAMIGNVGNASQMGALLASGKAPADADSVDPTTASTDPAATAAPGFKMYELKQGDSIQSIAKAEMGNVHRWRQIVDANPEFFQKMGEGNPAEPGTKIKIPTGPFTPNLDYKDALLDLIDGKAGDLDAAATTQLKTYSDKIDTMSLDDILATKPDNIKFTLLSVKLDSMGEDDVAKLKGKMDALGLKAELPAANADGSSVDPAANTPAANSPAANNTPAASTPAANNTPAANSPAANNTPAANTPAANTPAAAPVVTAPAANAPAATVPYTAKRNDSLWSIAQSQLGDANRWREILALNPTVQYPANPNQPNATPRTYKLADNPDFIREGSVLQLPAKAGAATTPAANNGTPATPAANNGTPAANNGTPVTPAANNGTPATPAANTGKPATPAANNGPTPASTPAANAAAARPEPTGDKRAAVIKAFNMPTDNANFTNFWSEVSTYPETAVGPDFGTDTQRKTVQSQLAALGFTVPVTGHYEDLGADGKPKTDASGQPISSTAKAIIDFKTAAGITQSYNVIGKDGKVAPAVNEYVDARTESTLRVTMRLLADPTVRNQASMKTALKEAADLAQSSVGPEVGSKEYRVIVQGYLSKIGYPDVKATGTFDDATIAALTDFKKKHNLAASYKNDSGQPVYTPYVDGPTANALYEASSHQTTKQ